MMFCLIFDLFLVDFWIENQSKTTKNQSKNQSKTTCKLGWILDRSWIDFWSIWGPSWGSSWGQVGTKIGGNGVPKRCQKIIKNLETQGHAVVPQWSGVQAPKRIPPGSSNTRVQEYKCPAGMCIRDTPLSGQRPGGGSNCLRPTRARAWDEGMSGCMVSLAGWLVG